MVVLIIFPVILQTFINVIMLSIGGQGANLGPIMHRLATIARNGLQGYLRLMISI